MKYQKIHCVNHVGKNLLIVGYNSEVQWAFRAVTQEGKIVHEKSQFISAEKAEEAGYSWIVNNLPV